MAKQNKHEQSLKQHLALISDTKAEDWFIVSRARHGMELILRALKEVKGQGSVITQPFTCVTAINPIIAAGFKPVYCDITEETFSIQPTKLQGLVDIETRAVVVQHSFGIPAETAEINRIIDKTDSILVEDSAHRLGFIARSQKLALADVSVHSFGSEKFLKTNFGGAIWLNPDMKDQKLRIAMANELSGLPTASLIVRLRVWLYPRLNGVLNRLPVAISQATRKMLLASKLFRSPIMPSEGRAINYEPCQRPSEGQMKLLLLAFKTYQDQLQHRTELTQLYASILGENSSKIQLSDVLKNPKLPCLRFPILAESAAHAEQLFSELRSKGMYIGKWYRPLFFPGNNGHPAYQYTEGSCPVAEDISARIINLPTDLKTTISDAKEIADELSR